MTTDTDTAGATSAGSPAAVTVAITRRVRGGNEAQMLAWVHAGTALAERFPGFLGTGWVRARPGSEEWHMLYRFADDASLAAWEASAERTWWLTSGNGLVEHDRAERRVGIEGWFDQPRATSDPDSPRDSGGRPDSAAVDGQSTAGSDGRRAIPPRWKQAVMIWSVFFPVSVVATYLLAPFSGDWPIPARVLLSTVLLTPLMTYIGLPAMTRALDGWLHAPTRR